MVIAISAYLLYGLEATTSLYCNPDFVDNAGDTCQMYADNDWCTDTGDYGNSWIDNWGTFEAYPDGNGATATVCPQCGCEGPSLLDISICCRDLDDDGHIDSKSNSCKWYRKNPNDCGKYDVYGEFEADKLCCACNPNPTGMIRYSATGWDQFY